jgi:hypothetical protein
MMHVGNYGVSRTRALGVLTLVLAVLIWLNVSVAGLPLVPLTLAVVAIALLW